jgi:hypothetical protein
MHQVQLNERLYKEAARRAAEAGFSTVDEYIADRLESDFSDAQEDFDNRFTPHRTGSRNSTQCCTRNDVRCRVNVV